jgi:hypothetical protein
MMCILTKQTKNKFFTIQTKEFIMSNELVTIQNGTEVAEVSVNVANLMPTTDASKYAQTYNVVAEYITKEKWSENGFKNPTPFIGKVLGTVWLDKIDQQTGEVKKVESANLYGGFLKEDGTVDNAFYLAGQAVVVQGIKQIITLGLASNYLKITCTGTKPNKHNGTTYLFSVIPLIEKV